MVGPRADEIARIAWLAILAATLVQQSRACPLCNQGVWDGIAQSTAHLPAVLTSFAPLVVLAATLATISVRQSAVSHAGPRNPVPLLCAAVVAGMGLGGFVDGIVMHQILQLHALLSTKVDNTNYIGKSVNMFWDGIFHLLCLAFTLTGLVLVWHTLRSAERQRLDTSGHILSGGLLIGWAVFNVLEGVVDHHVLSLHNVIEQDGFHHLANWSFLAMSVVMLVAGTWMVRRSGVNNEGKSS